MGHELEVDLGLWGKSRGLTAPYPVVCHLLDAGAAAGAVWDLYLSAGFRRFLAQGMGTDETHARQMVVFWAALHDIGKVMASFQEQDGAAFAAARDYPASSGGRCGHDFAVHVWLPSALVELGFQHAVARSVAQLLGGHHGCFFGMDPRNADPLRVVPELGAGRWESERRNLVRVVYRIVGSPSPIEYLDADAAALASGVVILADWLVSQVGFIEAQLTRRPADGGSTSLLEHYSSSVRQAPGLLCEAGLSRLVLQPGDFVEEHGFAPNDLQASIEANLPGLLTGGPGLLLIPAPPGEGKTEAALTGARLLGASAGAPGILFSLPTMSTVNQMYRRLSDYGVRRIAGSALLALLHSTSWLNAAYLPGDGEVVTEQDAGRAAAIRASVEITEWLLGAKRGLLAPWAAATIDQALMAGVRGRHNMVRMLGLAGKVLVVDEVHAYDAYMQRLLCGLLTWLGRIGVPVVLLSATVPKRVAQHLVQAYLSGAGVGLRGEFDFFYPGWLFADGNEGSVETHRTSSRAFDLDIDLRVVGLGRERSPERMPVLCELLTPVLETDSGCVGIVCNTVAEAQQVYRDLSTWLAETVRDTVAPKLMLLHSRFPADRRDEITDQVVAAYGKNGPRPRGIVVATAVIEQSIDIDLDLIVSDIAPLALLLQRAGRGHRHNRAQRPAWAATPRLVVLTPQQGDVGFTGPMSWRYYSEALLRRTYEALVALDGKPVAVPSAVQPLMEQVYDETFADGTMADDDIERIANAQVERGLADMVSIPGPDDLIDLFPLTDRDLDNALFSTRLGADSGQVVWCFADSGGQRWLDRQHTIPLPERGAGPRQRFTKRQVETVLRKSIPVPGTWVSDVTPEQQPPREWSTNPYLRKLIVLTELPGVPGQAELGHRVCELDPDVGLYRREK
ncbi:CRISPR-associated endonuclease Cas3'' [Nocardia sp. CNY236]|uniref:CRISPR-associated endonuclease Cas3'' n=1 Tax=Nocardia sp. CNY236 TaxID=1169152 RepID=UPI0003F6C129|nr:CRISPR-associated endonuclease Cas3'' [Nocardia sp. CNY236]